MKLQNDPFHYTAALALVLGLTLTATPALKAQQWDGGGADNWWSTANNWDPDGVPASGAIITFGGETRLTPVNDLTDFRVGTGTTTGNTGLTFSNDGTAGQTGQFTLSGTKLLLGGNITSANIGASSTPITDTISLDMELKGGFRIITAGSRRTIEISGVISQDSVSRGLTTGGMGGTIALSGLNTFTGLMRLNSGTTVMNTLTNSGTASSAGAGSIIELAQSTTDTTLRYVGAETSTDRAIRIGNAAANTANVGGGVIENNGSGMLTFSRATFNEVQADVTVNRTLTLGGTNDGVVAGTIQDNNSTGGGISLVKKDAGTWTINGANTYSGGTTVSAGTLLANNTTGSATGSGAVSVLSGASLGGAGFITPAANNSVTIDSGATLTVGNVADSVGSDLTITTSGSGELVTSGKVEFDIWSGAGAGDNTLLPLTVDRLIIGGGEVVLGGTLAINNPNSIATWAAGDMWRLFDWALATNVSGTFTNITSTVGNFNDLPDLSGDLLAWDTTNLYSQGTLSVVVIPEPSRALLVLIGLFGAVMRRRRSVRAVEQSSST